MNWSLKNGTIIFLVLIVIFFSLASLYIFQNTRSAITDASNQAFEATAHQSIETVNAFINDGLEDTTLLSHNLLFTGDNQKYTTELLLLYAKYDSTLEDITIIDLEGNVVESTTYSYRGQWNEKPWFVQATLGNTSVSDAHILTNPFKVVVEYCAPVVINNTTQYVVSGQLNLEEFWTILDKVSVGKTGFVMMTRDDGSIISHPDKNALFSKIDSYYDNLNFVSGIQGYISFIDDEETRYIGYVEPLLSDVFYQGQGSWTVWVVQQQEEAYAQLIDFSYKTLAVSFFVFFGLILGAVFFINKRVVKPLDELNKAAFRIGRGDFSTPIHKISNDEIGRVASAFEKMRLDLAKTVSRLKVSIAKQHELEKVDKLKSNILNITSHELRTPLTAMKGHLQMLSGGLLGEINDEQRKSLNVVIRNSDRLNDLIQDILDTSRLESGTMKFVPEKVKVRSFIFDVVETMKSKTLEAGINLVVEMDDNLPSVMMDKLRISQVLINLIGNATKFSEKNSQIVLKVTNQDDAVCFEVRDEGRGIPPEKQDKVFDIFFQVDDGMDRKFGGVGLGLAITKGIVISHGGRIWVESNGTGKGSSFKFTLPLQPVLDIEGNFKRYDIYNVNEKVDVPVSYEKMIADLDRIFNEHDKAF